MLPAAAVCLAMLLGASTPEVISPLNDKEIALYTRIVAGMRDNPHGPYSGILWYCADGSEQPPHLNGCAEHGGGHMYGVLGSDAGILARRGIYVGTILAPLKLGDLVADDYYRARALVVERYLERSLDGWVLKSAKSYRGFRQDEDEQLAARLLLVGLSADPKLYTDHRALLLRLSRALPYGHGGEALADEMRGLAGIIGDADTAFAQLRFKIHALPEPADIPKVEAYAQATQNAELADQAKKLVEVMTAYYDSARRLDRLKEVQDWVHDGATKRAIAEFVETPAADTDALLARGLAVMEKAEHALRPARVEDFKYCERNLLLIHTIGLVEEQWLSLTADISRRPTTRAQAIFTLRVLVAAALHVGLLSQREQEAAAGLLDKMASGSESAYLASVRDLERVLEWARARLLAELGLPLLRYQAVEARAQGVVDDILRSGVMLPLAALLDRLTVDAETQRGGGHRLFGISAPLSSLRGENPGLAVGPLRVVPPGGEVKDAARNEILLLHELPPELPPVAGVISVGSVGSLSHVALLARNLGIPLASVGSEVAAELAPWAGSELVLGVSQGRRVALGPLSALPPQEQQLLHEGVAEAQTLTIDTARLDLQTKRILKLSEISVADQGVRVGPKAAKLGELYRLFPKRVSDAAVIPFGAFVSHVDRPGKDGQPSPLAKLKAAYQHYREQKELDEPAAEKELLAALAEFRGAIATLPFAKGFEAEVYQALKRLGPLGRFGVFVRSDTNVEDLKNFTGAGLNLTVPNRVLIRDVLASIRDVWASPFAERSFRWRQKLLTNPEYVFPSVLLHRTVPSEISGVMVTQDLETGSAQAITVSASEGVAAVVDGGAPETLVLLPNGGQRLLASCRSATRKIIPRPPRQGVVVSPTVGKDPLLSSHDVAELRTLAAEVLAKMPPQDSRPWDIEFGLVRGKAYLLQIRPLKLNRSAATHPFLTALEKERAASVPLDLQASLP